MPIELRPLSINALRALGDSTTPEEVAGRVVDGALAPAFVAVRALAQLAEGKSSQWCSTFYILRQSDGMILGGCGFKDAPCDGRIEIGYAVAPSCRNQGVATAAVRALIQLAFASPDVHEVLAQIDVENEASTRLAQKLNFENRGVKAGDEKLVQWVLSKPS